MYLRYFLIVSVLIVCPLRAFAEPLGVGTGRRVVLRPPEPDTDPQATDDEDKTPAPKVAEAPAPKPRPRTRRRHKPTPHHFDWLAVPAVSYDSDYKVGYGAAAEFQWAGGVDPFRHQLCAQLLFSTGGLQSHWIKYEALEFLGTPLRFWSIIEFRKEKFAP
jgi:hypothetical protein